jgi:periplasmic protein CpxP/Spy
MFEPPEMPTSGVLPVQRLFSGARVSIRIGASRFKRRRKVNQMKRKPFVTSVLGVGALLLGFTFTPAIFAQTNTQEQSAPPAATQPSEKSGHRMHGEDRFAGLNLTEDQKAQIKKIHEDAKAKADSVKANTSLSDADKQAKVKEIHREAKKQVRAVLTPEQREQLKAKMRERHAERSKTQPS